ncbi:hypothetical protein C8Q78DRAFT_1044567, partial [Trametes maxima]
MRYSDRPPKGPKTKASPTVNPVHCRDVRGARRTENPRGAELRRPPHRASRGLIGHPAHGM